jgi:hypothetical protein
MGEAGEHGRKIIIERAANVVPGRSFYLGKSKRAEPQSRLSANKHGFSANKTRFGANKPGFGANKIQFAANKPWFAASNLKNHHFHFVSTLENAS